MCRKITRDFDAAFGQVDVLVSPTTPTTAFPIGERSDDPLAMYLADLCTIPSNLAGNASMSVPAGLSPDDGLPVGFQIVAPPFADDRLYNVGAALEGALRDQWGGLLIEEPLVLGVESLGDSAVVIRVSAKTLPQKQWDFAREWRRRIKKRLDRENIEIPFPHMTFYWGQGQMPAAPADRTARQADEVDGVRRPR